MIPGINPGEIAEAAGVICKSCVCPKKMKILNYHIKDRELVFLGLGSGIWIGAIYASRVWEAKLEYFEGNADPGYRISAAKEDVNSAINTGIGFTLAGCVATIIAVRIVPVFLERIVVGIMNCRCLRSGQEGKPTSDKVEDA